MILKKLRLRNIRSYTEQVIKFPIGSTLLAGDIGSGKSSILHAVEFALFGAMRGTGLVPGEALLRKGENDGAVTLDFSLEGKEISITRNLKRARGAVAQDAGHIIIDGRTIDCTSTELKARLLELLGYPKELLTKSKSLVYRYTVYTPQEQMKQILFESDEMRIDTLRKVFGIDRYKRMAENTTIYTRKIKEKKKELSGIMIGLEEKQSELKARKNSLAEKEMKKTYLRPEIDSIQQKKKEKKAELGKIELQLKELQELKKKVEVCDARLMEILKTRQNNNAELEQAEKDLLITNQKLESAFLEEKDFPPIEMVEDEILTKEKELASLSTRKVELAERKKNILERLDMMKKESDVRKDRVDLSAEKETLYNNILEELKDKEVISRNVEEVNNNLKRTETIISELSINQKNSELLKEDIQKLDNCPTCRQEVTRLHKQSIIDEEDRKLKKISAELEDMLKKRKDIIADLEQHNKKLKNITDKEHQLAGVKVEISNIQQMKRELQKIMEDHSKLDQDRISIIKALEEIDDSLIEQLKKELDEKKSVVKEINAHNLILKERKHNLAILAEKKQRKETLTRLQDELKEEVRKINSEKTVLNQTIINKSGIEETFVLKKKEFDTILEKETNISVQLGGINKEIEGIQALITSLQKDIDIKESAGKQLNHLNSVQEWLEKMFISLMGTMEKHIMAKVHVQFSELFSTWFHLLIEDENISVRIDDTFSPIINQNGYDTDINHLSGGEKTSIALAYRLALNRVINDLISNIKTRDLIILDEPTDGFSTEQLDKVRDVLEELNVKQTIIVSHESKIESFVDNIIRISKDEHVSRIVS